MRTRKPSREDDSPSGPPVREKFEPVLLGDLVRQGLSVSLHCRACGHWTSVGAAVLPIHPATPVPDMEGRFRCSRCGSRNSCAMPLYPRRLPGDAIS